MGFPSPAADYAETPLTITSLCGYDGNCHTVRLLPVTQSLMFPSNQMRVTPF